MKVTSTISDEMRQRILELYLCGDDRRNSFIAIVLEVELFEVGRVIQDYLDKKIIFTRGNFLIFHSDINYNHRN